MYAKGKKVKTSICIARLMYKAPLKRICVTETEPPGRYLGQRTHSLQTQPCAMTQQPATGSASQQ